MRPIVPLRMWLAVLLGCLLVTGVASATPDVPETVIITYQVKPDAEADLSRVIVEHWLVARHLRLVLPSPHILLRGGDKGKRYMVEILTWRDGSVPDNAPDAITRLWQMMNLLVEPRDGHPGIEFSPVSVVTQ